MTMEVVTAQPLQDLKKTPKRRKGGKAGRESCSLKFPKFESPEEEANFMMYIFKVAPCTRRRRHTWSGCLYAHNGETARRRDPTRHCAVPCPEMKQGQKCPRGDRCPYSHHDFEYWLHPTRYRTVCCKKTGDCGRSLCFFYHGTEEQRTTSSQNGFGERELDPSSSEFSTKSKIELPNQVTSSPVHAENGVSEEDDSSSSDMIFSNYHMSHPFPKPRTCSNSSYSVSSPQQNSADMSRNRFQNDSRNIYLHHRGEHMTTPQIPQIQSLLATNQGKMQGGHNSPRSFTYQRRSPSATSHGSISPTSPYTNFLGCAQSDDSNDVGTGVHWPSASPPHVDMPQMNNFTARRHSTPLMSMNYQEVLNLLKSASNENELQGLLTGRGTAHPCWPPGPPPGMPPISRGVPENYARNASPAQPGLSYEDIGLLKSPFLGGEMTNASLCAGTWDIPRGDVGHLSSYEAMGGINHSTSVQMLKEKGFPQNSFQVSSSTALMGMLGIDSTSFS